MIPFVGQNHLIVRKSVIQDYYVELIVKTIEEEKKIEGEAISRLENLDYINKETIQHLSSLFPGIIFSHILLGGGNFCQISWEPKILTKIDNTNSGNDIPIIEKSKCIIQ